MPDKSLKEVCQFLSRMWFPLLGPPRTIVSDQGREFVSEAFETFCSERSILLWHTPVQAPWVNGVAERSGGILKTILGTLVAQRVVSGKDGMRDLVGFACAAYSEDVNAEGVSPLQCVTGRQPRLHGSVLSNFPERLAEHGLIDSEASASQRAALRESARVAMLRLHYSQSIRRAELARSREPTIQQTLNPGDVVFFWRAQKAVRNSRRKLELRRWHGPGILVALENKNDAVIRPRPSFLFVDS